MALAVLAILAAAVALLAAADATAAPLRVTELRGSVQHGDKPLRLLDTLADGATVMLGNGAVLVAWDPVSDHRLVVAGPGRLTLADHGAGPVLAGAGSVQVLAPRRRPPAATQDSTVMAGAILRGATPPRPAAAAALSTTTATAPSTVTAPVPVPAAASLATAMPMAPAADALLPLAQADFSWRNQPHLGDWTFRLYDEDGAPVHEARVAERRYRLPPPVLLAPDRAYRWHVAWHDGRAFVQGPDQPVRTMATQVVALPAADASTAARIGAALQLRDNGQAAQARALAPELFGDAP